MTHLPGGSATTLPAAAQGAGAKAQLPDKPRRGGGILQIPAFKWTAATWTPGDVIRTVTTSHSVLHTTILSDGTLTQSFDHVEDKSADKTITVLACDARGPTKMRLEYRRLRFAQTRVDAGADGQPSPEPPTLHPLENRTFLLERDGSTFRVCDDAGGTIEEGLARLVLDEEGIHDGEMHRAGDLLARELSGRDLMPGEEIPVSHDVARAFVDGEEAVDAVSMTIVPKPEITPAGRMLAAFDVKLAIKDARLGVNAPTRVELSGELRIDPATGRYLSVDLQGTVTLGQATADGTRTVEVVGEGPWKIAETVTYSRVP